MLSAAYELSDGRAELLSPAIGGGWRVTDLDAHGPSGHTEYNTLREARRAIGYLAKRRRDPAWLRDYVCAPAFQEGIDRSQLVGAMNGLMARGDYEGYRRINDLYATAGLHAALAAARSAV